MSDPEVESSSLSHPKFGRNDDEKLRDAWVVTLSPSRVIRAPLSFDLFFLSFFSGLADAPLPDQEVYIRSRLRCTARRRGRLDGAAACT